MDESQMQRHTALGYWCAGLKADEIVWVMARRWKHDKAVGNPVPLQPPCLTQVESWIEEEQTYEKTRSLG